MGSSFVFFRCWAGFSEPFDFDRFSDMPDSELLHAMEDFASEQLRSSDVKAMIRSQREKLATKLKRQAQRVIGPRLNVRSREPRSCDSLKDDHLPAVCRLGKILGWWRPGIVGQSLPSTQVWFFESSSLAFAEALIPELDRRRKLDYDQGKPEFHLNPRFGIVHAERLLPGEQASIRRCIRAVQKGELPPVAHAQQAKLIGYRSYQVAKDFAIGWPANVSCDVGGDRIKRNGEGCNGAADTKGVSPRDAAEKMRPGDKDGQRNLTKTWANSRDPKLPATIGKDPKHAQRNLYKPTSLIKFLKIIEGERVDQDFGLSGYFREVSRLPRQI